MKRIIALLTAAVLAVSLLACSGSTQPSQAASAGAAKESAVSENTQDKDTAEEETVKEEAAAEEAASEEEAAAEEAVSEEKAVEEAASEEEAAVGESAAEETAEEAAEASDEVSTRILIEEDDSMINTYTLLLVNPEAPFVDVDGNAVDDVTLNTAGAEALINWMLSAEGKEMAKNFGYDEYGEYLFYLLDGGAESTAEIPEATEETKKIRLSTTTSVNDSGLLGYLLPIFEEEYGYSVEVFSAGTGKAIANAKMGNADAILVHAKSQEETFVADGFAAVPDGQDSERMSYMYNFFVLCGPSDDPAGVTSATDVKEAFAKIAEDKYAFISRGDGSGTHTKELSLWPESLGITDDPESFRDYTDWYISANAGMGVCLTMAEEMNAYILSDKATYLTFQAAGGIME